MKTFAPGGRVIAINTDLSAPIHPHGDSNRHPFGFPDGPLCRDTIYHVEASLLLDDGH